MLTYQVGRIHQPGETLEVVPPCYYNDGKLANCCPVVYAKWIHLQILCQCHWATSHVSLSWLELVYRAKTVCCEIMNG